jgi:hypothetical protein
VVTARYIIERYEVLIQENKNRKDGGRDQEYERNGMII